MATDREARALGAGDEIEVNGKKYRPQPIKAKHLCEIERKANKCFKENYLDTVIPHAKDIEPDDPTSFIRKTVLEVAKWGLQDLPYVSAYDASNIPITDKVLDWAVKKYDINRKSAPEIVRALVTAALDGEEITKEEVRKMSGKLPHIGKVRWDQWWVTSSMEGRLCFIEASMQYEHPDIKGEDIGEWPMHKIIEAAHLVENITTADVGNT